MKPVRGMILALCYDLVVKRLLLVGLCGGMVLLSGCSALGRSDMVGSYKDNNPAGVSTLTLNADGTYSRVTITKAQKKQWESGTWNFDSAQSQLQLGGADYPVEKIFPEGQPQIVENPDEGIAYGKVK